MASTPSSELADGPVMTFIAKRIRSLKKKLNRIAQMEVSIAQGKTLHKEQEEVLKSKASVLSLVEELEKMRPALSAAVAEEVSLAVKNNHNGLQECQDQPVAESDNVEDLLKLIYFGATFDLKNQNDFTSAMLTRQHERQSCISYDTVLDGDNDSDMLRESDLDLVAKLGNLMITRPIDSCFSHKDSLQKCIQHAKQWLTKSSQPIDSDSNITYADLSAKLNKIIASGYFTATPQIKATVDIAAAAAGNYTFQVPVGTVLVSGELDDSVVQFHQKDEEPAVYQENGNQDSQSSHVQEATNVEYQPEDQTTLDLAQNGSANYQEEDQNEGEFQQKQYRNGSRRSYNNNRGGRGGGGRRGGFQNGRGGRGSSRGGGPYQSNGRSQYQENGQYYPRSYHNNGKGGANGGGRGGAGAQASYAAAKS